MEHLAALYRAHAPMIHRRAKRLLGNEEDARDVVHDVFEAVMRPGAGFRGESRPETWLYAVTTNLCLNRLRNARRRDELLASADELVRPGASASPLTLSELRQVLTRLPDDLAALAVGHYIHELGQDELAALHGCSRRSIHRRLARLEQRIAAETATGSVRKLPASPGRGRAVALVAASAATLLLAWWLVGRDRGPGDPARVATAGWRGKGAGGLAVYARRDGRVFVVEDGARLRAGDTLRFVVTGGPLGAQVAVLDLEQSGRVVVAVPAGGARSIDAAALRTTPADDGPSPLAFELDGSRGREAFVAVACATPFAVEPVRRTVEVALRAPPSAPGAVTAAAVAARVATALAPTPWATCDLAVRIVEKP